MQALGALALIAGIALVILQLQQNEKLLRFQIATDLRVNRDNDRNAMRGEEYSATLAKLQISPDTLSDAQLVQFDAHAQSLISELDLRRMLALEGIFAGNWRDWFIPMRCQLFNNPVGRVWLQTQRIDLDQEMMDELENRLTECSSKASFIESVHKLRANN